MNYKRAAESKARMGIEASGPGWYSVSVLLYALVMAVLRVAEVLEEKEANRDQSI